MEKGGAEIAPPVAARVAGDANGYAPGAEVSGETGPTVAKPDGVLHEEDHDEGRHQGVGEPRGRDQGPPGWGHVAAVDRLALGEVDGRERGWLGAAPERPCRRPDLAHARQPGWRREQGTGIAGPRVGPRHPQMDRRVGR